MPPTAGIQYRSVEAPDVGQWVLKGYQADIDFQIDDDPKARAMEGLIGFQMHTRPPMKVEFKDIVLKNY